MNWKSKALIVSTALALAGGWSVARAADDMAGMNMGEAKKPAKETAAVTAKRGEKGEKVEIAVTENGFEPDKVTVKKGEPVELVFTRTTDKTCIKVVVLDTGAPKKIQKALPLNKPVIIKTKFAKAGSLSYACNMNMFSGTVTVQ
jgi:plastocyanin domain-containing protein